MMNRDWLDRIIVDPELGGWDKAKAWAKHAVETVAPIPGLIHRPKGGGIERLIKAAMGQGRETLERAILREFFGIKVSNPWISREDAFKHFKGLEGLRQRDTMARMLRWWNDVLRSDFDKKITKKAIRTSVKRVAKKARQDRLSLVGVP